MFPTLTGATVPYPSCASHTKIDRTDRHREMKKKIGRDKEPESTKPPHTPQATKTTQTRDDDEIAIQSYSMLKDRVRERSRETESPRKTQQKIEKETQREKERKTKSTENTKQISTHSADRHYMLAQAIHKMPTSNSPPPTPRVSCRSDIKVPYSPRKISTMAP